jgi:hypothetical protein
MKRRDDFSSSGEIGIDNHSSTRHLLGMILNDEIKIVPIISDALSDKNDTRGRLV